MPKFINNIANVPKFINNIANVPKFINKIANVNCCNLLKHDADKISTVVVEVATFVGNPVL